MKVKSPHLSVEKSEKGKSRIALSSWKMLLTILFACAITFIITIKLLMPSSGYLKKWPYKRGHNVFKDDLGLRQAFLRLPLRLMKSWKPSELPKLNFDIKFKHFTKLTEKRAEALDEGILVQKPDDFVPAAIRMGNRTIKVKIRLKGDWTDHLEGNKWSFRVRVKGKEQLFGMKRFSIQNPKVRGYQSELLFQETLRGLGILAPRYFFVEVVINGDDIGIMALEEHFSKELLESNGCRENVIVRFDESLVWAAQDGITRYGRKTGFNGTFDNYQNAVIDAFQSAKIQKSKHLRNEYDIAVGLLRGFMDGHLSASRVFDAELFGKYLGASEFWGAKHATRWHNLRFYLNPITLKLEPIGFDADLRATVSHDVLIAQNEPIFIAVLQDKNIFNVYHETIQKLGKEILEGGNLKNNIDIVEKKALSDLRKEFYLLEKYPYSKLYKRANYLLSLSKIELRNYVVNTSAENKKAPESLPTLIHAFRIKDDNGFHLELANATPHEVEVRSINWIDTNGNHSFEFQQLSRKSFPILLEPTPIGSLPKIQRISYRNPSAANLDSLEISAAFSGQKKTHKTVAISYSNVLTRSPVPESTPDEQLSRHNFLTLDNPKKSLLVQPGIWHVSGSLVIPAGFTLKVSAGTTLKFSPNEGLFSHGPLFFHGTSDRPIILEGISSKDHGNSWQGITVLNANSKSVWSHVIVRDTAGLSRLGWVLTGGVTFYKSDISMSHCRLKGNLGEDALNIIHSKFELTGIEILESTSDGFDADFADGEIKDCLFKEIGKTTGGDAIDISGSEVLVTGCRFLNISDKALSVGEQSKMTANNLLIEHVGTGAASKDGSQLNITNSTIKDAYNAGLMAYVKKAEFGAGRIEANKLVFFDTEPKARVQKGSSITLNGERIDSEDIDVEKLYKTTMRPGLRR